MQKNQFVDFKFIYTQSTVMISHPFRIGFVSSPEPKAQGEVL